MGKSVVAFLSAAAYIALRDIMEAPSIKEDSHSVPAWLYVFQLECIVSSATESYYFLVCVDKQAQKQ